MHVWGFWCINAPKTALQSSTSVLFQCGGIFGCLELLRAVQTLVSSCVS